MVRSLSFEFLFEPGEKTQHAGRITQVEMRFRISGSAHPHGDPVRQCGKRGFIRAVIADIDPERLSWESAHKCHDRGALSFKFDGQHLPNLVSFEKVEDMLQWRKQAQENFLRGTNDGGLGTAKMNRKTEPFVLDPNAGQGPKKQQGIEPHTSENK